MIGMTTKRFFYSVLVSTVFCISAAVDAIPFTNLFNPYDILLYRPIPADRCFELDVTYEGAFSAHGFQTDPEDKFNERLHGFSNEFRRKVDVLQLWQDKQNFFAALHTTRAANTNDIDSDIAQEAFLFTGQHARRQDRFLEVNGHFNVPLNLMMAARMALPHGFEVGVYLPVFIAKLSDITWREPERDGEENRLPDRLVNKLEKLSKIDLLNGWRRFGVGDLAALAWWTRDYPQMKRWLKNVGVSARGGFTFPTGTKGNIDRLFSLPFGDNGGTGLIFGGTLELGFLDIVKLGVDGEFLKLFGTKELVRFKTHPKQTDLVFNHAALAFKDPGFLQHYTLYLSFCSGWVPGFSARVAYQHTRQHETTLTFNTSGIDAVLANTAESLQDWTTHSIIWMADCDLSAVLPFCGLPVISGFVKHGFNGKRALLFDTAGVQLSLSY